MDLNNKAETAIQKVEGKVIQADRTARGKVLNQECAWNTKKTEKIRGLV